MCFSESGLSSKSIGHQLQELTTLRLWRAQTSTLLTSPARCEGGEGLQTPSGAIIRRKAHRSHWSYSIHDYDVLQRKSMYILKSAKGRDAQSRDRQGLKKQMLSLSSGWKIPPSPPQPLQKNWWATMAIQGRSPELGVQRFSWHPLCNHCSCGWSQPPDWLISY